MYTFILYIIDELLFLQLTNDSTFPLLTHYLHSLQCSNLYNAPPNKVLVPHPPYRAAVFGFHSGLCLTSKDFLPEWTLQTVTWTWNIHVLSLYVLWLLQLLPKFISPLWVSRFQRCIDVGNRVGILYILVVSKLHSFTSLYHFNAIWKSYDVCINGILRARVHTMKWFFIRPPLTPCMMSSVLNIHNLSCDAPPPTCSTIHQMSNRACQKPSLATPVPSMITAKIFNTRKMMTLEYFQYVMYVRTSVYHVLICCFNTLMDT